jgi:hypothetical protein
VLKHFQERLPYCSCWTSREEPLAPGCVSSSGALASISHQQTPEGAPETPPLRRRGGVLVLVGGWPQAQISKIGYPGARINFEDHYSRRQLLAKAAMAASRVAA